MQIYKYPSKVLTHPCLSVDILGPKRSELVNILMDMMDFYEQCQVTPLEGRGMVGLAAPQVGHSLKAFVAQGVLYINPTMLWKAQGQEQRCFEGCFSLPDNKCGYEVYRAYGLKLKWQDINGEWFEKRFNGFPAQVIQHEFDHTLGLLCNHQ